MAGWGRLALRGEEGGGGCWRGGEGRGLGAGRGLVAGPPWRHSGAAEAARRLARLQSHLESFTLTIIKSYPARPLFSSLNFFDMKHFLNFPRVYGSTLVIKGVFGF